MQLNDLRGLTTNKRDECKQRAKNRVERHIGERPTRAQFQRELGRLWTVLDVLALVVFIPSLLVSSIHIITFVGDLASRAFGSVAQANSGTTFAQSFYVAAHQWALIPLAEGSMILFLVMFGVSRDGWRRWVYALLAALAVVFVLVSNLSSGLGLLVSALAPAFTIGIGLKLEHLIMQYLKRSQTVTQKYLEALAVWEVSTQDATQHPQYKPYLMHELWTELMKLKSNQWAVEASPGFKRAAVERELEREEWTTAAAPLETTYEPSEEVQAELERPKEVVIVREPDESAAMPIMLSANGHGMPGTN